MFPNTLIDWFMWEKFLLGPWCLSNRLSDTDNHSQGAGYGHTHIHTHKPWRRAVKRFGDVVRLKQVKTRKVMVATITINIT